jgi:hypothetical protein
MNGITDNPPHTLTASQLAGAWLDAGSPPEWKASDGSDVYRFALVDLDYEMSYLLRVASPETGTVDMLDLYVYHGKGPKGWDLRTNWHYDSRPFFSQDNAWLLRHHHQFIDWTLDLRVGQ